MARLPNDAYILKIYRAPV